MRIYSLDGVTHFDTDDLTEARLLDEYAAQCAEVGAGRAAARIAQWLDAEESEAGTVTLVAMCEIARRIRSGEWRIA